MKKSILLDKSQFNFLLERIENKYSYDEYENLSKKLLVEGGPRSKLIKLINTIDDNKVRAKLKEAGVDSKDIDDVIHGLEFVQDPTNINTQGFYPLILSKEFGVNVQKGFGIDDIEMQSIRNTFKKLADIHTSKIKGLGEGKDPVLQYVLDNPNLGVEEQFANIMEILEDYPNFFDTEGRVKFSDKEDSAWDWVRDSVSDESGSSSNSVSGEIDKTSRVEWKNTDMKIQNSKSEQLLDADGKPIKNLGGTESGPVTTNDSKTKKLFSWLFKWSGTKGYWDWVIYGGKKGKKTPEDWFTWGGPVGGRGGARIPTEGDIKKAVWINGLHRIGGKAANILVLPLARGLVPHPALALSFLIECIYKMGWAEDKKIKFEKVLSSGKKATTNIPFIFGNCLGESSTYIDMDTGKVMTYNPMVFPLFSYTPTPAVLSTMGFGVGAIVDVLLEPMNPAVNQAIGMVMEKIDATFNDMGFLELLQMECTPDNMKTYTTEIHNRIKSLGDDHYVVKWVTKWISGYDLDKLSEEDTQLFLEALGDVDGGVENLKTLKDQVKSYMPIELQNKEEFSLGDLLLGYCNMKRISTIAATSGSVTHELENIVVSDQVVKNTNKFLCEEYKLWKRFSCPDGKIKACAPTIAECNKNAELMLKVITAVNNDDNLKVDFNNTLFDQTLWTEGCKRFNDNYDNVVGDWVCAFPPEITLGEVVLDIPVEVEFVDIYASPTASAYKYKWETMLQVYTLKEGMKNRLDGGITCNKIQDYANSLNGRYFKENKVPLFSDKVAWKNEYNETLYDISANDEVVTEFQKYFCVAGRINDSDSTVEQCKTELKSIMDKLSCAGYENPNN